MRQFTLGKNFKLVACNLTKKGPLYRFCLRFFGNFNNSVNGCFWFSQELGFNTCYVQKKNIFIESKTCVVQTGVSCVLVDPLYQMFLNSFLCDVNYFFKNSYQQLYHYTFYKELHVLIQFFVKSIIKQLKWNFQKGNSSLDKKTYSAE